MNLWAYRGSHTTPHWSITRRGTMGGSLACVSVGVGAGMIGSSLAVIEGASLSKTGRRLSDFFSRRREPGTRDEIVQRGLAGKAKPLQDINGAVLRESVVCACPYCRRHFSGEH
jgi:hypothetical protein